MLIKTYIFWQNILSIHMSAFIRALADRENTRVFCAHEEDLCVTRTKMGWTIPDYGRAQICDVRNPDVFNKLCNISGPDVCHAFGGYLELPVAYRAFLRLRTASCQKVWISEAFDFYGWRGYFRLLRCRLHVLRNASKVFDHVFAMGQLGVNFFNRTGISSNIIHEFSYLIEPLTGEVPDDSVSTLSNNDVLFLYVGQVIHRKGIDLLLQAISRLPKQGWHLLILGDGEQRYQMESLANKLDIAGNVEFLGNKSNQISQAWMSRADALVLPSRWDGWGAVVNEALMAGCPAIVSDACGAASLLANRLRGDIFARERIDELSCLLEERLRHGKQSLKARISLMMWAQKSLSGENLANYFCSIVSNDQAKTHLQTPWQ